MSPPLALHALGREGEKTLGRGPAPLRIARREMHPDIALRQRAEHRVGQGVQHDVAIGMGDDAPARAGIRTPPSQTWSPSVKA